MTKKEAIEKTEPVTTLVGITNGIMKELFAQDNSLKMVFNEKASDKEKAAFKQFHQIAGYAMMELLQARDIQTKANCLEGNAQATLQAHDCRVQVILREMPEAETKLLEKFSTAIKGSKFSKEKYAEVLDGCYAKTLGALIRKTAP